MRATLKLFTIPAFFSAFLLSRVALAQLAPVAPPAAATPGVINVGDVKLTPLVEVRSRGEYHRDSPELGGLDALGQDNARVRDAWGVFERPRLGLSAERDALKIQLTLEDARVWGTPYPSGLLGQSTSSFASTGVYEAYIEARTSSATPSFVRLGRQAITWGEGALIGNADWSPVGRSFDALRARGNSGMFGGEALAAVLEPSSPLGVAAGQSAGLTHSGVTLFGLEADVTVSRFFKLEAYGIARIARSDGSELDGSRFEAARASGELYAAGLRAFGEGAGFKYSAEGTYEVGTASALSSGDIAIDAFAAHGHVSKKFDDVAFTPTLRIGGAYATGDDGSGTYKQFDPLFADPHQYGMSDIFALSNHIEGNFTLSAVPMTDMLAQIEYRYAVLQNANGEWLDGYLSSIGSPSGVTAVSTSTTAAPTVSNGSNASTDLGHEISLLVSYKPWRGLDLSAGYDMFIFGDGARTVMALEHRGLAESNGSFSPANLASYAYLQATARLP